MENAEALMRATLAVLKQEIRASDFRTVTRVAEELGMNYTGLAKQLAGTYPSNQMNASTLFEILALLGVDWSDFSESVRRRAVIEADVSDDGMN